MRFPGRAFISLFICLLTHSANSSGTSTKLWPGMISEISFPKTSVFAVKKPSFPKTSVFGPMNNHTRMRLVLPQKGAFLPGTWRSPAWLTLLNSIKEDEVQSLLWALQPYFIHPLQISHIFEILCDTAPPFEFSAILLKCFSFWKLLCIFQHSSHPLREAFSALPWSGTQLEQGVLTVSHGWAFPACLRCAGIVPQVLCTCHSLCSWPCAVSESFWCLLMSQLSDHISKWGPPCSPLRPGLFWLLPESGLAGSEGVELASGKLELSLGLQIQYC